MSWLQPANLALLIPITAIVAFTAVVLVKLLIRHRERIAMIEQGLHPDHPRLEEEDLED